MISGQDELAEDQERERIPDCPCCKTNQHVRLFTRSAGNGWLAILKCLRCQRGIVATRKATGAEAVREVRRAWTEMKSK